MDIDHNGDWWSQHSKAKDDRDRGSTTRDDRSNTMGQLGEGDSRYNVIKQKGTW